MAFEEKCPSRPSNGVIYYGRCSLNMKLEGNMKNQRFFKVRIVYGGHFKEVTGKRHRPKPLGRSDEEINSKKASRK